MNLGFVSDSLGRLPLTQLLDHAARLQVAGVEVNAGGWSTAPHLDLKALLASAATRQAWRAEFSARGLLIAALNANGNPLHPTDGTQSACLKDTLRLAGELGVKTVCTMSGLPEGAPGDVMPNWVVTAWPPENQQMLAYQWNDILLPYWSDIVALAKACGVERIALELHGNQCVYNVPTLLRLRQAVGPVVGANLDPSHLFWMGADPLAAVDALGNALYHVHAKDTLLNTAVQATHGVLDSGSLADVAARAWSYVTLGYGHDERWWRSFCYRLRMAGYDGWLSIEHEDVLLHALDGLEKSVRLLKQVMPLRDGESQLQAN